MRKIGRWEPSFTVWVRAIECGRQARTKAGFPIFQKTASSPFLDQIDDLLPIVGSTKPKALGVGIARHGSQLPALGGKLFILLGGVKHFGRPLQNKSPVSRRGF